MDSIEKVKRFFDDNQSVYRELENYCQNIIERNRCGVLTIDTLPEAYKCNMVIKFGNGYKPSFEYFNYVLLNVLKQKVLIDDFISLDDYCIFRSKVHSILSSMKDGFTLKSDFESFLFYYLNQSKGWDFKDYILSINEECKERNFFFMQHDFLEVLPHMGDMSKNNLLEILEHFGNESKGNSNLILIFRNLIKFCSNNPQEGWEFVKYCTKLQKNEYISSCLEGLYSKDPYKTLDYAKKLFLHKEFQIPMIQAFGRFNYTDIEQVNEILELLETVNDNDEKVLHAKTVTFGFLLNHPIVEEKEKSMYCIEQLEMLSSSDFSSVRGSVLYYLSCITQLKKYENIITEILFKYTKDSMEDEYILNGTKALLLKLINVKNFFKFISDWVLNQEQFVETDFFNSVFPTIYERNPSDFIYNLIRLLIYNKGKVRWYANSLLNNFFIDNNNAEIWEKQLLSLDEQEQIKFIVSVMTFTMISPLERLRLILTLRKNKSERIFTSLLEHFILLMHDFRALVENELKQTLKEEDEWEKGLLNEFLKNYESFEKIINEKSSLKEFDPSFNQPQLQSKFNSLYYKNQSSEIHKIAEKQSIISHLTNKIQIGKGSKIRIEGEAAFKDLVQFEYSAPFPLTYYLFPERFESQVQLNCSYDWGKNND